MATFTWYNGNLGFYRYTRLDAFDFESASETATSISAVYNPDYGGDFDPTEYAYSITLEIADTQVYEIEEGDDAGDIRFIDGDVTGFKYYDIDDNLIMEISGISLAIEVVESMASFGNFYDIWQYASAGDNTYTGSKNASTAQYDDWNGDSIETGAGDDTVNARGGDDFISDGGGADIYNGGGGSDTIDYSLSFYNPAFFTTGIVANLKAGTIIGGDGETDTVNGIENVRGSSFADTILGDNNDNRFAGLQGDDVINGRGGFDIVRYDRDINRGGEDGVRVNLANGTARDGFGNIDTLKNIEGVRGSDQRDRLNGDNNENYIDGRGGNDIINGNGGDDYLRGNSGGDKFVFSGNGFGHDIISDYDLNEADRIEIKKANSFSDLTVTQVDEGALVEFGSNSVLMEGWNANDVINLESDIFMY